MRISDWSSDVCSSDLGDNYKFEYRHDWDNLSIGLYGFRHEAELTDSAADASTRNDVAFLVGSPTNADLQLAGSGTNTERWRNRYEFGLTAEYLRSEEHTSEIKSLMRISYAVLFLK